MRKFIILFLILCSVCWPATIKIGIIADVHIDATDPSPTQPFGDSPGYRLPAHGDVSLPLAVTRFNDESVDIAVQMGDAINGGVSGDGNARDDNFDEFVDIIDGTAASNDALSAKLYYCLGHWDVGETGIAADDYDEFFAADGMGTIIPGAGDVPAKAWWPAAATTDDQPCAYVIETTDFYLIFLAAIAGGAGLDTAGQSDDTGGGDNEVITQLGWLEVMLDEAEAASEPVIIFTHQPLRQNFHPTVGFISGYVDGLTLIERAGQTIKPIVVAAHIHSHQDIITANGVVHINLGADVWGTSETDTGRFSHCILEVTSPTWTDPDGQRGLITLTGYGHQRSASGLSEILVGHWKLNETNGTAAGADNIVDSSGNAYHGTSTETVVSVTAPVGRGITLDGTGDYIDDTSQPLTAFPCSLSAWYYITNSQTSSIIGISNAAGTGAGLRMLEIQLNAGKPRLRVKGAGGIAASTPSATKVILNEWVHVVGVWVAADDKTIYVNGKFDAEDTDDTQIFPATSDTITIGALSSNNSQGGLFTGNISDVRMYPGALLASDVSSLYRGGTVSRRHRQSGNLKNDGFARTRN